MNKSVDRRFFLALFIAVLLILSQFFFRYESSGGIECLNSLTHLSPSKHQITGFSTFYGFPFTFLTARTDGCFEKQITLYDFGPLAGLLIDIIFIGILSMAPYWFHVIWKRFRPA